MKKLNVLMFLVVVVTIVSCKDDEEKPSKTKLLTSKKWSIVKYELGGADVTESYSEGECAEDDYDQFNTDGTFMEEVGTTLCYDGETDDSGTWQWKENETILSLHYTGDDPYDWELVQLNSTTLKISRFDVDENADLVITLTGK